MMQFIFTAGFWDVMPGWLADILLAILHLLDQVVFVLINWMYRVFILVSEVDIFKDGTQIEAIVNRIYVIVGVAMLFIFAYNLILLIINPEGKQLGNMAKVIQNAIISVILIIFLPTIFSYLKLVQNHIVTENVIGNIILGTTSDYDAAENTNKRAGVKVALDIYSAFYHPVNESYVTCKNMCCPPGTTNCDGSACKEHICYDYVNAYNTAYKNSSIADFIWDKNLRDGVKEGKVEYLAVVSTVAGAFALWMFISFALDIGIRVGKLAFYEVISPIPVMMRILPGDKMFDKWFKGVKDAYLSIFIRLIIIYTCMYFITLVPDIFANMWASGDAGIIVALANVVVILGILQFAKDAPKLISDMFGGSGDLKFGVRDKYKTLTGAVRGGVYGATTGEGWGRVSGFFRGAGKGATKGYDAAVSSIDGLKDARRDGSTFGGRLQDRLRVGIGMRTRYDSIGADEEKKLKKARIEDREKNNQAFVDAADNFKKISENIVTSSHSLYRSVEGYGEVYDKASEKPGLEGSGITYSLANKNYYEMQEVIEEARRNKASADTIVSLTQAMEKHKEHRMKLVQQTELHGGEILLAEDDKKYRNQMSRAKQQINNALEDGAAQYIDESTGKLVSGIVEKDASGNVVLDSNGKPKVITKVEDLDTLKYAQRVVNESKNTIQDERRAIHKDHSHYKAERADSNYVKNSSKDKK